eukprot:1128207-Rhodomonas_salina.1
MEGAEAASASASACFSFSLPRLFPPSLSPSAPFCSDATPTGYHTGLSPLLPPSLKAFSPLHFASSSLRSLSSSSAAS